MATATSIGPSTITCIEKEHFRGKIDRDLAFAEMLITCLLAQTARLKADLIDHFFSFSERRLARLLLMHTGFAKKSRSGTLTLRFSQGTLAEMVGTTRSRINGFMNEFRKKGYLRYNGGVQIDSKRLSAFLEE